MGLVVPGNKIRFFTFASQKLRGEPYTVSSDSNSDPIVRSGDAERRTHAPGQPFRANIEDLSDYLPVKNLGVRRYFVEPGDRAWPFHAHLANEELIVIERGQGTVRTVDDEFQVTEGDVIGFGADPQSAHQLINTSDDRLVYLCVSTMREPDVTLYPDSDKVGVLAGEPPGGDSEQRMFETYLDAECERDYWDGEVED